MHTSAATNDLLVVDRSNDLIRDPWLYSSDGDGLPPTRPQDMSLGKSRVRVGLGYGQGRVYSVPRS